MYSRGIVMNILYSLCSSKPFPGAEDFKDEITAKEYLESIEYMVKDNLIKNVKLKYGGMDNTVQLAYNKDEAEITRKGIKYLKDNKHIVKLES